ncbi:glycerol-3-phosphate 1-O-acyltransferase PlsY [Cohnella rhizosphaerae]|uniref:Glycerol-3-phosphate acyltransferase n=1 Tax=Cohnella rhizosphaerae TaxID=1457232 RepID=A0A9X4KYI6_9BACL|nr:glycerol-3-phosphate 1-O-acyltransferase PlsY [Cohnella rhizosphaerae]MDG0813123.1 glycerol-3-phosphate 1-O-acyltransferase PlsY [Cohnella rhizosphaerae]
MLPAVIAVVVSYLLGSVSFSILFARWLRKIDIRQHGSGNAGATNTLRVLGKGPAIAVFLLDIAKGLVAVAVGQAIAGEQGSWLAVACGLASIAGHNWPLYFRFKGGKGIATTVGALIYLAPLPVVAAGVVAIVLIVITRYVSLGSMVFAALVPVILGLAGEIGPVFWGALVLALLAILRHRKNIVKLMNGTENKIGAKKKEDSHGI